MSGMNGKSETTPNYGNPSRTTVTVTKTHLNGDTHDAMKGRDVADGYGIRVESGRNEWTDLPEHGGVWSGDKVELIVSRNGGAFYVVLTPREARKLAVAILAAADCAEGA